MNKISNRRERRFMMKARGILKMKSRLPFSKWTELIQESIKAGNEQLKSNADLFERSVSKQLEQKELKMIEYWKSQGFKNNEIEKLRDAYAILSVRFLDTWKSDKKDARKLINEANQSLLNRING
jgi:hypothetical protein